MNSTCDHHVQGLGLMVRFFQEAAVFDSAHATLGALVNDVAVQLAEFRRHNEKYAQGFNLPPERKLSNLTDVARFSLFSNVYGVHIYVITDLDELQVSLQKPVIHSRLSNRVSGWHHQLPIVTKFNRCIRIPSSVPDDDAAPILLILVSALRTYHNLCPLDFKDAAGDAGPVSLYHVEECPVAFHASHFVPQQVIPAPLPDKLQWVRTYPSLVTTDVIDQKVRIRCPCFCSYFASCVPFFTFAQSDDARPVLPQVQRQSNQHAVPRSSHQSDQHISVDVEDFVSRYFHPPSTPTEMPIPKQEAFSDSLRINISNQNLSPNAEARVEVTQTADVDGIVAVGSWQHVFHWRLDLNFNLNPGGGFREAISSRRSHKVKFNDKLTYLSTFQSINIACTSSIHGGQLYLLRPITGSVSPFQTLYVCLIFFFMAYF